MMIVHHKRSNQMSSHENIQAQEPHHQRLLLSILSPWIFGVCFLSKKLTTLLNCSTSSMVSLSSVFHPCYKSSTSSSSRMALVDGVNTEAPELPSPCEVPQKMVSSLGMSRWLSQVRKSSSSSSNSRGTNPDTSDQGPSRGKWALCILR